ncbi:MAG: hypothetical protein R3C03_04465 [Pirellulaceae bacterium]
MTVDRPLHLLQLSDATCPTCSEMRTNDAACLVELDSPQANLTFEQLGVPEFDIVKIRGDGETIWVRLDGDQQWI